MTRRARRAVEVRRDEILAATVELVDRIGLANTRVADVAAALGVSPSLVFYHFGTKDDLVAEAFGYAVEHDLARLEKAARPSAGGDDPVERLRIVRESMQGLKESKQALAAKMIIGLEDFAQPTILSMAARTHWSTRLFNMIVTNVPGPQFPIYMLGRELLELVPVAFLPDNYALTIAAMSYNGKLDFSLLGDYDAMPDIDLIGTYVEESLDELLEAAGRRPAVLQPQ